MVEQAGKEAHGATPPAFSKCPNVPVKKNRGNGGTRGTPSVFGASSWGTCSPLEKRGNSDNQTEGKLGALIFKNIFVFPLFPNTSIRGNGYKPRGCWLFPRSPCSPRFQVPVYLGIYAGWGYASLGTAFTIHGVGVDHVQACRPAAGQAIFLVPAAIPVGVVLGDSPGPLQRFHNPR